MVSNLNNFCVLTEMCPLHQVLYGKLVSNAWSDFKSCFFLFFEKICSGPNHNFADIK